MKSPRTADGPFPEDGGGGSRGVGASLGRIACKPAFWLFVVAVGAGFWVGRYVPPTWTVEAIELDVQREDDGRLFYVHRDERTYLEEVVPYEASALSEEAIALANALGEAPAVKRQFAVRTEMAGGQEKAVHYELVAQRHWGWWSLLPAVVAVVMCWVTKEPLAALFSGVLTGALLLGRYDITEGVLVERLASPDAAGILLLYLWLLGGLMGVWSRTGAAQAFGELMTRRFVRGPRSAKVVAWCLGVIFFQGGSISAVLVGTTARPVADRERVSHEELAYIVDSTASPIASLLAFNAWPGYVQAFIFVAGVPWLATREDRIWFFFASIPFCLYAILAVLGTFLLSIEKPLFVGRKLQAAMRRARETGELDAADAEPLGAKELQASRVPPGYVPHVADFLVPLLVLIGIAIGTFIALGTPMVTWAFGAAVGVAMVMALVRGMSLRALMEGYIDGLKGVLLGSVILLLAVTIGGVSKDAGGGLFLVEQLGERMPYWLLPVMLQAITMIISFSTGTSWGTYAVSFPLAMPLAWAVANAQGLDHPRFFMMLCFAAVMDGSVYGDQCSPISDTTVLSAMCTGCDLMDHVKTQMPQASVAAALAGIGWTLLSLLAA